jgi:hypothetical protein
MSDVDSCSDRDAGVGNETDASVNEVTFRAGMGVELPDWLGVDPCASCAVSSTDIGSGIDLDSEEEPVRFASSKAHAIDA